MSRPLLLEGPVYGLGDAEKTARLLAQLNALTRRHRAGCPDYRRLLDALGVPQGDATSLEEVPALPVGLFKSHRLASVPEAEVFKVLTSSGTSGQVPSRIYLDRETASLQSAALSAIMQTVLGPTRLPMLVVDTETLLADRTQFSARGAGVLGMMNFGRSPVFALDAGMAPVPERLERFLAAHGGAPFLIFGFTFMVWQYLYQALRDQGLDLSQGILVHSGGWKKLQEQAVDNAEFKRRLRGALGLRRVHSFYGMVEQVGSVFLEGEDGFLYPPAFADVIVRDPVTWRPAPPGQPGIIEVLSALPRSYPGHALLTEDLGVVHGVDDSTCGRMGRRFSVLGRVPRAELRGCSDTHAAEASPA